MFAVQKAPRYFNERVLLPVMPLALHKLCTAVLRAELCAITQTSHWGVFGVINKIFLPPACDESKSDLT